MTRLQLEPKRETRTTTPWWLIVLVLVSIYAIVRQKGLVNRYKYNTVSVETSEGMENSQALSWTQSKEEMITAVLDEDEDEDETSTEKSKPTPMGKSKNKRKRKHNKAMTGIENVNENETETETETEILVAVDQQSSYAASDVSKIVHVPAESRIEIHLKAKSVRRCQTPRFLGRISGWSLSMIDFEYNNNNNNNNSNTYSGADSSDSDNYSDNSNSNDDVVVGTYDLFHTPVSGKYFVEILVVLCEVAPYNSDAIRDVDLRTICLEDMSNARITEGNGAAWIHIDVGGNAGGGGGGATTTIPSTSSSTTTSMQLMKHKRIKNPPSIGRWLHKSIVLEDKTGFRIGIGIAIGTPTPAPIFTRYQPKECALFQNASSCDFFRRYALKECVEFNTTTSFCAETMAIRKVRDYEFRWEGDPDEISHGRPLALAQPLAKPLAKPHDGDDNQDSAKMTTPTPKQQQHTHVCFVGASHSMVFQKHCDILRNKKREPKFPPYKIGDLSCSHHYARFPDAFNITDIEAIGELGCTHVVVGLFQWYFSYQHKASNITFSKWKDDMTNVARMLETAALDSDHSLRRVLLRSAHPHQFQLGILACPLNNDFRTVPNAIVANSILQEIVAEEFEVEFEFDYDDVVVAPIVSFVDTSSIIDPVFDSPRDWSHHGQASGMAETRFVLIGILNEEKRLELE